MLNDKNTNKLWQTTPGGLIRLYRDNNDEFRVPPHIVHVCSAHTVVRTRNLDTSTMISHTYVLALNLSNSSIYAFGGPGLISFYCTGAYNCSVKSPPPPWFELEGNFRKSSFA